MCRMLSVLCLAIVLTYSLICLTDAGTSLPKKYPRYSFNAALDRFLWFSNRSSNLDILPTTNLSMLLPEILKEFTRLRVDVSKKVSESRRSCVEDVVDILEGFYNSSTSAKWIDALGRPQPGISGGAIHWPGSFELCLSTYGDYNINQGYLPMNNTKNLTAAHYCNLVVDLPMDLAFPDMPPIGISIGLCLPSSCNISSFIKIINPVISKLSLKVDELATYCHSSPDALPKDRWFWIGIALTTFYLILMACGTILDLCLWLRWKLTWVYNMKPKLSSTPDAQGLLQEEGEEEVEDSNERTENSHTAIQLQDKDQPTYTEFRSNYLHGKPLLIYWLSAYSVPINAAKLWTAPKTTIIDSNGKVIDHPLSVLDGMRCLTILWIIYGHCMVFSILLSNNVLLFAQSHLSRWTFQVVLSGTFSVDTFFLMSGLLTSYITIPRMNQLNSVTKSIRFWSIFILHRIIRLTPVYFTVIVLHTAFFHHAWDGPMFPQRTELTDVHFCHSHWWVTYLNNLVYSDEMCLPWSWYLANELQFSIVLAPIFLCLLRFHASAGLTFAGALIISSMSSTFGLSYANHYLPGMLSFQSFSAMYMKPYTRWSTYAMGLILGWILHSDRLKLPQRTSLQRTLLFTVGGMTLAAVCCMSTVFGLYSVISGQVPPLTNGVSAFYNAFSRPVFSLGIAIIIYLCANQYATPIRSLLSWSGFNVLSRLTYGVYMVHPIIIFFIRFASQSPALMDDIYLVVVAHHPLKKTVPHLLVCCKGSTSQSCNYYWTQTYNGGSRDEKSVKLPRIACLIFSVTCNSGPNP